MTRKTSILLRFIFLFYSFLFFFSFTEAAGLYFSPSFASYKTNDRFSVSVNLSSPDQAVNAVAAVVNFPQDKLEVISLSKTNSIFSFWIQEPNFSNESGTINFEGVIFNPGFIGNTGRIITLNFKVKKEGIAKLSFSSASVLANDGEGTNILKELGNAQFNLSSGDSEVSKTQTPPSVPQIFSSTHPDQDKWYTGKNAKFNWHLPSNVTAIQLSADKSPNSTPTIIYSPPIKEKEIKNLEDGIWYFHLRFRNEYGWGETSHFRFQIDSEPPKSFEINIKEGQETVHLQPTLIFEAIDEVSGIDYYEIQIDDKLREQTKEKEFKIPYLLKVGKHSILVKAVDRAGNSTIAMKEVNILYFPPPVITDYPKELLAGSILVLKGTAVPEATIKIYLQRGDEERVDETKSDKEGKWLYISARPLEKGVYQVWAQAIDSLGAKSQFSQEVEILVLAPCFLKIGKTIIYCPTILFALFGLILILYLIILRKRFSWRKHDLVREGKTQKTRNNFNKRKPEKKEFRKN